jgi:hypothetical protein
LPTLTFDPLSNFAAIDLFSPQVSIDPLPSTIEVYAYDPEKSNPITGASSKACGIHDRQIGNGSKRWAEVMLLSRRQSVFEHGGDWFVVFGNLVSGWKQISVETF